MFKYSSLQQTIATLHHTNPLQLNRSASLVSPSKIYQAYPLTTTQGTQLCILMPKDMAPRALVTLNEESALASRVVVMMQEANTWSKVWPNASVGMQAHAEEENQSIPDMELIIED